MKKKTEKTKTKKRKNEKVGNEKKQDEFEVTPRKQKDAAVSQETSLVLQTWLSKRVTRLVSVYVHRTVHLNGTAQRHSSRDHLS